MHNEAKKGELGFPQRAGLCSGQSTNVQLEADSQVRKLEEELRFKKNIQLCTTPLASELADKMGEQGNEWRPRCIILQR